MQGMNLIYFFISFSFFFLIAFSGVLLFQNEEILGYQRNYSKAFSLINSKGDSSSFNISNFFQPIFYLNAMLFIYSGIIGFFTFVRSSVDLRISLYPFAAGLILFWFTIDSPLTLNKISLQNYETKGIFTLCEIAIFFGFKELIERKKAEDDIIRKIHN